MSNETKKEVLDGIQSQISSFDNKASILLTVVGIVFALAISFLEIFNQDFFKELNQISKVWFYIIFISFIVITSLLITLLILVIVPRKHKGKNKYPNFYSDIDKMQKDEFIRLIEEYETSDDLIVEQIKINSKICNRKHLFVKISTILFGPFIAILIVLVLMILFIH